MRTAQAPYYAKFDLQKILSLVLQTPLGTPTRAPPPSSHRPPTGICRRAPRLVTLHTRNSGMPQRD